MKENQSQGKVLLIDDSEIIRETVRATLEQAGYQVLTADSGLGASILVLRDKPDLVLIDVAMPALSGDQLAGVMRRNLHNFRTWVVLFSDKRPEELERLVHESGADGYIRKTDDERQLTRAVAGWMSKARSPTPASSEKALPRDSSRGR